MVFHTAPPQPASKARMICSPLFVGGAEASQKGFNDAIPAKLTARFGVLSGMCSLQSIRDRYRSPLALGHRIHYLAAAVRAVACREVPRVIGLACPAIHNHNTAVELEAT